MKTTKKVEEYAYKLLLHIQSIFNEDCENYIDKKDFLEDENFKAFLHALANAVPAIIFNKFCNEEKTYLEFNHIANALCFENSELEKKS